MRVYLDACCLTRPFDDQSIDRNRLEAEAVMSVLRHIHQGDWQMVASNALSHELAGIRDPAKKENADGFLSLASQVIEGGDDEFKRTEQLTRMGFRPIDALHIACAEAGACEVLLTTDDQMLRVARRNTTALRVEVENPLDWILERRNGHNRNDAE